MKAIPAIVWLELSGISVDLHKLEELKQKVQERKDVAQIKLYEMVGDINLNSTQQLKKALNDMGIPVENTKAEEIAKYKHPVLDQLKEYKNTEKLLNTFIGKMTGFINPATGRVHADYNQIGAVTGRIACRNPNMQQQPSKKLHEWKEIFIAGEGNKIATADYSQIELRILAQLSGDEEYIRAYKEGTDLHKLTASKIFNKPLDQVTSDERSVAKTVNFGIAYGMWIPSLQMKLKPLGLTHLKCRKSNIVKNILISPSFSKTYGVMDINPPKCSDIDFINFLIAGSNVFSCTEAARCYTFIANAPSMMLSLVAFKGNLQTQKDYG